MVMDPLYKKIKDFIWIKHTWINMETQSHRKKVWAWILTDEDIKITDTLPLFSFFCDLYLPTWIVLLAMPYTYTVTNVSLSRQIFPCKAEQNHSPMKYQEWEIEW